MSLRTTLLAILFLAPLAVLAGGFDEAETALAAEVEPSDCLPDDTVATVLALNPNYDFDYKNTREWNRSRVKKFAGSALIGVGVLSTFACGLACIATSINGTPIPEAAAISWLTANGLITLSSIPFYVSAHKDRKKARSLTAEQYYSNEEPAGRDRNYRQTGLRYQATIGANVPLKSQGSHSLGPTLALEARSYLGKSNLDLAFVLEGDIVHEYPYESWYWGNWSIRLSAFADYNFDKGAHHNPYVGFGPTIAIDNFFLSPRAGLEIDSRHRVGLQFNIAPFGDPFSANQNTSNIAFTYSYTF